ncbi:MAG: hypothetical protein HXY46_09075 [Syntrophaceae bacterium]|nr:hypothetical protein [Syntrophaceae bacterium]
MIKQIEMERIEQSAYLPEHIPQYVTAISRAEPFISGNFLTYVKKDHLIFIGYPLQEPFDEKRMKNELEDSISRFRPKTVSLTAPSIPFSHTDCIQFSSDYYYRLDLSTLSIPQKTRNMIKRAGRELSIEKSRSFDEEHRNMVENFMKLHPVDEGTQFIFRRIGEYLASSVDAWIFNARNSKGDLVAFDIAEFKPRDYGLYMFNFTSEPIYVPGASDLLLSEMIQEAKTKRKRYLNLGLGINSGITFFKKKWGGVPFLRYAYCLYTPSMAEALNKLMQKL